MSLDGQHSVSLVIPTFNGASRISACLRAVRAYAPPSLEVVVVDDGSTDNIAEVVSQFSGVRLITQTNAGPAAARNRGASEARGDILLFTDDDCIPTEDWFGAMLRPFQDSEVVGAKGVYRTHQRSLTARFVQVEYEDKYRIMRALPEIDFIDTYSAAYRRDRFLEMDGYDTSFPVACAEDIELSYRMSARNWKMKFAPDAVVYHTHPDKLSSYLAKKYKFAFWRVLAVRKNPQKGVKDSHTPQMMKLQLLLGPALLVAILFDLLLNPSISLTAITVLAFFVSTLPFAVRALQRDMVVGLLSPGMLALRSFAQFAGVSGGMLHAFRSSPGVSQEKVVRAMDERYSLRSLYRDELLRLLYSERRMIEGLQRIAGYARDAQLSEAIATHMVDSQVHLTRLSEMVGDLDGRKESKEDALTATLLQSVDVIAGGLPEGAVRDAALIALCRRFEHYEIALYSTAAEWARALGLYHHERLLDTTLVEEKAADALLGEISQAQMTTSLAA